MLLAAEHAVVVVDDHSTTYEDVTEVRTLAGRLDVNLLGLVVSRIAHVSTSTAPPVPARRAKELDAGATKQAPAGQREITGSTGRKRGPTRTKS